MELPRGQIVYMIQGVERGFREGQQKNIQVRNKFDINALIECPYTVDLWRQIELWLRTNINRNIKIFKREKIFSTKTKQATKCVYC